MRSNVLDLTKAEPMTEQANKSLQNFLLSRELSNKKVLVCILNWGLGHASRCIPLIESFEKLNNEVFVLSSGPALELISKNFPGRKCIDSGEADMRYGKSSLATSIKIALQSPRFIRNIRVEEKLVEEICQQEQIDFILSDNRYGCRSKLAKSVFLGHQLNIPVPIGGSVVQALNKRLLNRFDEVWVPDYEGPQSLAGRLAKVLDLKVPIAYIGPLSRFNRKAAERMPSVYDKIFILSGPEPQRSLFEADILAGKYTESSDGRMVIVRGLPQEKGELKVPENWVSFNHLNTEELLNLIEESKEIVCRSGYSSIMDLHTIQRVAKLVPTPGQAEQEYLALLHKSSDLILGNS